MKKKFLLTLAIATVLFCLFAVSTSAVTTYDDFDVTALENIEYRADDIVVFDDGFSCPSVYVFKDTDKIGSGSWGSSDALKKVLDFTYINSKVAPKEYGFDDIDSLDIPQGVTSMGTYSCHSLKTIRIISIPDTVVSLGSAIFQNSSGLEYCIMEHGEDSALTTLSGSLFSGSGLKAFSMPDCITTLSSGYEFESCKSMQAVYLSKNLTAIDSTKACFDWCGKMYLVNEPFVATSESQIPAKPSIYYFPSNLATLGTAGVFRGSNSINDVLVFGTKLTAIKSRVAFQNCPANTVVFLGDMTEVVANETYYWGTKNFIFANPNDKSASDLDTLALKSDRNAYFCYGEGNTTHLVDPKKTVINVDATCTTNAFENTFCFCGMGIDVNKELEGTALGHSHTVYKDLIYNDFSKDGYYIYKCERCDDENTDTSAPALFKLDGFSTPTEYGKNGLAIGFEVNEEALSTYKATGKTLTFGAYVAGCENVKNDNVTDMYNYAKAIKADVTVEDTSYFAMKVTGFENGGNDDTKLCLGAYVVENGVVSYLQAGEAEDGCNFLYTTYNLAYANSSNK